MHEQTFIKNIRAINWRCFNDTSLELNGSFNLLTGPNGCGKTSILEAISLLSTDRTIIKGSFTDLIQSGSASFCINAVFDQNGINHTLYVSGNHLKRTVKRNNLSIKSVKELIPAVCWTVDDILLANGPSVVRRSFIDKTLCLLDTKYYQYLMRYKKAIEQRNFLLKKKKLNEIETWNEICCNCADYICNNRNTLCHTLGELFGNTCLKITYSPSVELGNYSYGLKAAFEKNKNKESVLGFTLNGPHKDEFIISFNGFNVKNRLSRGQCVSVCYALRKAQLFLLNKSNIAPIILIDEVALGIDSLSIKELGVLFSNINNQVIASTSSAENSLLNIFQNKIDLGQSTWAR